MLAKKGTFMQAVQRLTEEVNATYGSSAEGERLALFNSAKRAYTLLCSRYTAVGFWRVGRELFSAVHAACRLACHPSLRQAIPDLPSLPTPPPCPVGQAPLRPPPSLAAAEGKRRVGCFRRCHQMVWRGRAPKKHRPLKHLRQPLPTFSSLTCSWACGGCMWVGGWESEWCVSGWVGGWVGAARQGKTPSVHVPRRQKNGWNVPLRHVPAHARDIHTRRHARDRDTKRLGFSVKDLG